MKKWIPASCDALAFRAIIDKLRRVCCTYGNYVTGIELIYLVAWKYFFLTRNVFRLCVGRVPNFVHAIARPLFSYDYFVHALETGGRADSEGFRRIETRAKSNSVVLPSKLESFNRRRSVRDRAPPLLFRIEYMPFYVAARPRSVDGSLHQPYRVAFWTVRVDLISCLDSKING